MPALLFALLAFTWPLSDADIWWHLSAGRAILEHWRIPKSDLFCLSSLGAPWIDLHWGFQLLVYLLERSFQDTGLVLLRAILVGSSMILALGRRISWDTMIVALLAYTGCRLFLDLRPLLLTLPLLIVMWGLLERPGHWSTLPITLLLQVLLVNTQGLFLLGPLLVLAHAAGQFAERDTSRGLREGVMALLMIPASLLNPWGPDAFQLAFRVAGRILPAGTNLFSREIPENLPMVSWALEDPARLLPWAWAGFGTILLWNPRPGRSGRSFLLAGSAILSLLAVRNLPFLGVAMLICIQPRPWTRPWMPPTLASLATACLLVFPLRERRWDLPGQAVAPAHFPGPTALRRIRSHEGPIFHEIRAGGWLTWTLPGRTACWADTRLVLHDARFVAEYLDLLDHPDRFDSWSRSTGVDMALIPTFAWPRFRGLATHLLASPEWSLLDADGAWMVMGRDSSRGQGIDPRSPVGRESISVRIRDRFGANERLEARVRTHWSDLLRESSPGAEP